MKLFCISSCSGLLHILECKVCEKERGGGRKREREKERKREREKERKRERDVMSYSLDNN